LVKQAAKKVVWGLVAFQTVVNDALDCGGGQEVDVLSKHCHEKLENKALSLLSLYWLAWSQNEAAEKRGHLVSCIPGDAFAVVLENGLRVVREEKVERRISVRKVAKGDPIDGLVELLVEVIDPEFFEVA
jgi:hypothetical protein